MEQKKIEIMSFVSMDVRHRQMSQIIQFSFEHIKKFRILFFW